VIGAECDELEALRDALFSKRFGKCTAKIEEELVEWTGVEWTCYLSLADKRTTASFSISGDRIWRPFQCGPESEFLTAKPQIWGWKNIGQSGWSFEKKEIGR
jgi:hypothetical protein